MTVQVWSLAGLGQVPAPPLTSCVILDSYFSSLSLSSSSETVTSSEKSSPTAFSKVAFPASLPSAPSFLPQREPQATVTLMVPSCCLYPCPLPECKRHGSRDCHLFVPGSTSRSCTELPPSRHSINVCGMNGWMSK